jgi:hypothetical protein
MIDTNKIDNIGEQIDYIKERSVAELLNLVNGQFKIPFVNLLTLSNVTMADFEQIIMQMDKDNLLLDEKYVDYFELIRMNSFDYLLTIIHILSDDKLEKIATIEEKEMPSRTNETYMVNYVTPGNVLIEWIFHHIDVTDLILLWKRISEFKFSTKVLYGILLTSVNRYYNLPDNKLLLIIKDIIERYPEATKWNMLPIFSYVIWHLCKAFATYPDEEYKQVKYELSNDHKILLDIMINNDRNVINEIDTCEKTSLVTAIQASHVTLCEYLLHHGADYNYISYYGDITMNPFLSVLYGCNEIRQIFIKIIDNINFSIHDKYMNSYANRVFYDTDKYDIDFKILILKKSHNLHKINVAKQNFLHILFSKYFKDDPSLYYTVLVNKRLNWLQKDLADITPLSLAKNHPSGFEHILNNLLGPNYVNYILAKVKRNKKLEPIEKNVLDMIDNSTDQFVINNYILTLYENGHIRTNQADNTSVILLEYEPVDIGAYSGGNNSSYIHIYDILLRHRNIGILKADMLPYTVTNPSTDEENLIYGRLKYYYKHPYIFNHYALFWFGSTANYIQTNNLQEINTNEQNKPIYFQSLTISRFIHLYFHANTIIYNTIYKYVFRFEPHGNIPLGNDFDDAFEKIISQYMPGYIYYRPKDYMPNFMFQTVSKESDPSEKKLGDPRGYCSAWALWFLESYAPYCKKIKDNNDLKKFVGKLFNKIIYNYRSFVEYIRYYGAYLTRREVKFLKTISYPSNRYYTLRYTDAEMDHISTVINNKLKML